MHLTASGLVESGPMYTPFSHERLSGSRTWSRMREAVDVELHSLAILQWAQALVVRAAGDDVTRVECDGRRELDELGDPVLHVVRVVVVPELAIHPELHVDIVGLRYLVSGGDAGQDFPRLGKRGAQPDIGQWHCVSDAHDAPLGEYAGQYVACSGRLK